MEAIKGITTRYRFNKVVETSLLGFIAREADRKGAAAK
jgi:hypothetical protein